MLKEAMETIKEVLIRMKNMEAGEALSIARDQIKYWGRVFRRSARLFIDNRGPYQANALAYRTMVSLVPMLAFMISLLTLMMGRSEIEMHKQLQEIMQRYLVPDSEIIQGTFDIISKFVEQAKGGTLVGFIVLLLTSVFLINAIEVIFNNIWHITRRRTYGWRMLSFTAMTILIPVLLGVSIYITAKISVDQVVTIFTQNALARNVPFVQWMWEMFRGTGLPLAMVWALFLAMYKWIPNTRVEISAALISSFTAAVAFEICKWAFTFFAAQMVVSRQFLWGSLAVFLVFLMWVYLIWLIILFGAQLCYVIQNYRFVLRINPDLEKRVGQTYLACRVMLEIAKRHLKGEQVPSVRELAGVLEVEVPRIQFVLARLMDANLIILGTTSSEKSGYEEVYVPGRDLGTITVAEVVGTVNDAWRLPSSSKPSQKSSKAGKNAESPEEENKDKSPEDRLDLILNQSKAAIEADLKVSFREIVGQNLMT